MFLISCVQEEMGYRSLIKFFTLIVLNLVVTQSFSQRSHSIGIYIGGSSYLGDVNPSLLFYKPSLAIGGVYRYNINPHYSFKTSFIRCKVDASDSFFSDFQYQILRNYKTDNIWMLELSEMVEFNFMPMDIDKTGQNLSPYIELGAAVAYANLSSDKFNFAVPFGLGCKYRFSKRFEVAVDWCFRKTFTDKLDGLDSEFGPRSVSKNKQMSFVNTTDWYYTYGVSFLYLIRSKKKCQGYSESR